MRLVAPLVVSIGLWGRADASELTFELDVVPTFDFFECGGEWAHGTSMDGVELTKLAAEDVEIYCDLMRSYWETGKIDLDQKKSEQLMFYNDKVLLIQRDTGEYICGESFHWMEELTLFPLAILKVRGVIRVLSEYLGMACKSHPGDAFESVEDTISQHRTDESCFVVDVLVTDELAVVWNQVENRKSRGNVSLTFSPNPVSQVFDTTFVGFLLRQFLGVLFLFVGLQAGFVIFQRIRTTTQTPKVVFGILGVNLVLSVYLAITVCFLEGVATVGHFSDYWRQAHRPAMLGTSVATDVWLLCFWHTCLQKFKLQNEQPIGGVGKLEFLVSLAILLILLDGCFMYMLYTYSGNLEMLNMIIPSSFILCQAAVAIDSFRSVSKILAELDTLTTELSLAIQSKTVEEGNSTLHAKLKSLATSQKHYMQHLARTMRIAYAAALLTSFMLLFTGFTSWYWSNPQGHVAIAFLFLIAKVLSIFSQNRCCIPPKSLTSIKTRVESN